MPTHRSAISTDVLARMYRDEHLTLTEIARRTGLSRTAISKRLAPFGIIKHEIVRVALVCAWCDELFEVPPSDAGKKFDTRECAFAARENAFAAAHYVWRNGGWATRAVIVKHFPELADEQIVEHRNERAGDNRVRNLRVWSAGVRRRLAWDGAKCACSRCKER